jgi:hypothetical protein
MIEQAGFVDVEVGSSFDTFGGARGEGQARKFGVRGYTFNARKPG